MARLTAAARKRLPAKKFALPGGRFPVNDKVHAEKALQLVGRSVKAGNTTPAEAATVRAKAKAVLGKGGKSSPRRSARPNRKR